MSHPWYSFGESFYSFYTVHKAYGRVCIVSRRRQVLLREFSDIGTGRMSISPDSLTFPQSTSTVPVKIFNSFMSISITPVPFYSAASGTRRR